MPLSVTQDEIGPLTRNVADAAHVLDIWAGYDPEDPITAFGIGKTPATYADHLDPDGLQGARIGVLRDFFGEDEIHTPVNDVVDAAMAEMEALGATLIDVTIANIDDLTDGMGTSSYETAPAFEAYLERFGEEAPFETIDEIGASGLVHPDIQSGFDAYEAQENALENAEYRSIFYKRDQLRLALMKAMADQDLDVLFYPHQKRLVVPVGEDQVERNGVLSNPTGFPAITFQGGFSEATDDAPLGVPVGIELLGPEFSEPRLIELVYSFEQGTDHRQMPAYLSEAEF